MELIDKAAIVAKIDKMMQELHPTNTHKMQTGEKIDRDVLMWLNALTWVKDVLNSIETKDVDLDFQTFAKEMGAVFDLPSTETKNTEEDPLNWEYAIARHFFNLGLKAREGK
jgi:hypothetical protein